MNRDDSQGLFARETPKPDVRHANEMNMLVRSGALGLQATSNYPSACRVGCRRMRCISSCCIFPWMLCRWGWGVPESTCTSVRTTSCIESWLFLRPALHASKPPATMDENVDFLGSAADGQRLAFEPQGLKRNRTQYTNTPQPMMPPKCSMDQSSASGEETSPRAEGWSRLIKVRLDVVGLVLFAGLNAQNRVLASAQSQGRGLETHFKSFSGS